MLLYHEKLWEYANGEVTPNDEGYNVEKDRQALSTICLSIDSKLFVHVEEATVAKKAWDNLAKTFEPQGTAGRLGMLQQLISTRLADCKDMTEYVNKMMSVGQQIKDANFKVEELVGCMMLIGLTPSYRPMAMVLDHSGQELTADYVKNRLLAEEGRRVLEEGPTKALAIKSGAKELHTRDRSSMECGYCHKLGHIKKDYYGLKNAQERKLSQQNKSSGSNQQSKDPNSKRVTTLYTALSATNESIQDSEWFIDSGATNHMSKFEQWMQTFQPETQSEVTTANDASVT